MKCGKLLGTLRVGENYKLWRARKDGGVTVYAEVERGRDTKESVIVISSENSGQILLEYKQRRKIETLFENLKSRGFELEETPLTEAAKTDKLCGVLALAAAWAAKTGELESAENPIRIKHHGRPQKSLFRLGCENIQAGLFEITSYSKVNIFEILRC